MRALLQQLLVAARRQLLVALLLGFSLALVVVNYFLWQQRRVVTREHEEVRHEGEAMLLALTDQARIKSELAELQAALAQIDRNLLVEGEMEVNLGYFYRLERLSRVRLIQLNQLSSQPSAEGNPFKAVPFSLRATGSYPHLMSFLHQLETGPRLARVRTYSFSRGEAKSNTLDLDLTVELLAAQ
jgi:Tfp pilus assembly protein PilO